MAILGFLLNLSDYRRCPKKTLVNFRNEYRLFLSYPRDMRVLIVTNLVYGLVMPVVEMFIAAYIMRKSDDVKMVVTYQLSIYTGIPFTFLVNGWLLKLVNIKRLYSAGMLLSSVSMVVMMTLGKLSVAGLVVTGVLMGMSFGLYWSNRDFLSLSSTNDSNRNYYYGLENFFATNLNIGVPLAVGSFIAWFAAGNAGVGHENARFGGENAARVVLAYQMITGIVFAITFVASVIVHQGRFQNPPASPFLYYRYHWLWNRMQLLAVLKGIGQGYTVDVPAMLVMTLVGKEGSLGRLLSAGGVLSAVLLYIVGRTAQPAHRIWLLAASWSLFAFESAGQRRAVRQPRRLALPVVAGAWPAVGRHRLLHRSRCWSSTPWRRSRIATSTPTSSVRNSAFTSAVLAGCGIIHSTGIRGFQYFLPCDMRS